MLRIWKESDRVLWMLILLYLVIMTVAALPAFQRSAAAGRPATLLEMAWAAEGNLSEADRTAAHDRLAKHLSWMEDNLPRQWGRYTLQERAAWVFESMHEHLLFGKYDEDQNSLSQALLKGDYNCVSATILYQILTERAGLPTVALVTDMDRVLGRNVGNALEVVEAVDYLTGAGTRDQRLHEVTMALAGEMIALGHLAPSAEAGRALAEAALSDGRAAERFGRMVAALGGPDDFLEHSNRYLGHAPVIRPCNAERSGHVAGMNAREIGIAVVALGGGRWELPASAA